MEKKQINSSKIFILESIARPAFPKMWSDEMLLQNARRGGKVGMQETQHLPHGSQWLWEFRKQRQLLNTDKPRSLHTGLDNSFCHIYSYTIAFKNYFGKCNHKPQSPRHQSGSTKKLGAYALRYPSCLPTSLGSSQRFAAGKEVLMVAPLLYDGLAVSTCRPKIWSLRETKAILHEKWTQQNPHHLETNDMETIGNLTMRRQIFGYHSIKRS